MKVLPPAPITTCPLSLPGSPQVNGFLYELKMFLWKAMEKKTKTDSGNILLHMYPHFLSLGHHGHGCFSRIGLLCTLCSMASDCLQYTPLLVTRQCVVSTSQGWGFYLHQDHWIKQLFQSSSGSSRRYLGALSDKNLLKVLLASMTD